MMAERGVVVSHTTIMRWVIRYAPEFEKRWSRFGRSISMAVRWISCYGPIAESRRRKHSFAKPLHYTPIIRR
jgi:hypothetical protein